MVLRRFNQGCCISRAGQGNAAAKTVAWTKTGKDEGLVHGITCLLLRMAA